MAFVDDGLALGLGLSSAAETPSAADTQRPINPCLKLDHHHDQLVQPTRILEPSLTLGLCRESNNVARSIQRERVIDRVSSGVSDDEDGIVNARKKLRLDKDQSAVLEESFKQQNTINPKQKQELARKLNLKTRQVEVWFQNRRARTKLKQTEVDCEFLKKCCETLADENRKLQKELLELKAMKLMQPFCMKLPAAALTLCPSCKKIGSSTGDNNPKSHSSSIPSKIFHC